MICVVAVSMEWWRFQLGWVLYVRALGMAWVRPAAQHDASSLQRCGEPWSPSSVPVQEHD